MNSIRIYSILVIMAAAPMLILGACGAAGERAHVADAAVTTDDDPIRGGVAVLTVYGMSCPLCANNVDNVLLDVPGVTGVDVDMGTGRATVRLDAKRPPTRAMLARAVEKSGFSLQGIEVP
jgi:copper chaperone CopZ